MSRKLFPLFAMLFLYLVVTAGVTASAQTERPPGPRPLALGCCKCLGESNTLNLSTITGNPWTINGNPAVQTAVHPAWTNNPGPAKWFSTTATGNAVIPNGSFVYQLPFTVPNCTIDQRAILSGNMGGDNDITIRLDNPNGPVIAQCTGGWCFNSTRNQAIPFSVAVGPGNHQLYVTVVNAGAGPSGMFVNAILTAKCASEPVKPSMEPGGPRQ